VIPPVVRGCPARAVAVHHERYRPRRWRPQTASRNADWPPFARHYRDEESLPIAEIARRLGRAPATVKAYLYDPTGEKAQAVKRRYQGVCRGCGSPTTARGGKGDAFEYCKRCHPGAIAPTRTREWVRDAMRAWRARYGSPPSSTDWSCTHARRRGGEALNRLRDRDWPAPSTVVELYGTWAAARADAFPDD
jgi:hypothetical protein